MTTYSIAANEDDGESASGIFGAESELGVIGNYGGTPNYHLWFRFPNIAAAQGQTCASAYITFKCAMGGNGTGMYTAFYGVDEDNHAAPQSIGDFNTDCGLHTTAKVDFDFTNTKTAGNTITSPSLVSIFDEIFARPGWTTGNNIGIHWEDDGSSDYAYRWIALRENTTYTEPVLTLTLNDVIRQPRPPAAIDSLMMY